MKDYLLKGVTLVETGHPLNNQIVDIKIQGEVITEIGSDLDVNAEEVINLSGQMVSSGWIDAEIALSEPGYESKGKLLDDLSSISKNGFTHIGLLPNTLPLPDKGSALSFFNQYKYLPVSILPFGTLSLDSNGEELAELYDLKQSGAIVYVDYKKGITNTGLMKLALQYTQPFNGIVGVFPCDHYLKGKGVVREGITSTRLGLKGIPSIAESIRIQRDLELLRYTGGKIHFMGVSTSESVELIREAKQKGLSVTASVSIGNLYFNDEKLEGFDSRYKLNPPLANEETRLKLIDALMEGTIDIVVSDHFNCSTEEKNLEFDLAEFGSKTKDYLFPALSKLVGVQKAVEILCRGYQLFQLPTPNIKEGSLANLSFFATDQSHTAIEKDPQTELFYGESFENIGTGSFFKGMLTLR
ncbi:MAG: dihydroorotase [Bacteroidetes bacterium]|nr:dihydroorotase [Flavobacteriaceae bacterium]PTM03158.1 MAG: dihydroorotase [Bacteroidota bacterium]